MPSATDGPQPFTVNQVHDFSTMALAPAGTSLWHAQKHDFAPRLGIAWNSRPNLVIRAGAGIFYDLGYSLIASVESAFPYVQQELNRINPLYQIGGPRSIQLASCAGKTGGDGAEPRGVSVEGAVLS